MTRHAVVAGANGLIGSQLVRLLARDPSWSTTALVRRAGSVPAGTAREMVFPFEDLAAYERLGREIPCDVFFCCLGTTLRQAGSPEAFRHVDRELPARFFRALAALPQRPLVIAVSSLGADKPRGLYLETKAAMESDLAASGLPHVVVRPSLLLGDRPETRLGERVAAAVLVPVFRGLTALGGRHWSWVGRMAPIPAATVAAAMLRAASTTPVASAWEGWDLYPAAP